MEIQTKQNKAMEIQKNSVVFKSLAEFAKWHNTRAWPVFNKSGYKEFVRYQRRVKPYLFARKTLFFKAKNFMAVAKKHVKRIRVKNPSSDT